MLNRGQRLAIYMEGALQADPGKMGFGILRYSPNPIACVIDSAFAGKDAAEVTKIPRSAPVVAGVAEAVNLGAEVFVLGIAPPGGLIPEAWYPVIEEAIVAGMSIVNGLHDLLKPRYPNLLPGQWIWDIRVEPEGIGTAHGDARHLENKRVLLIGTDMAIGKMTAGLEMWRVARERGIKAEFVATGQIGITITGSGVPLDAVRVDFASGAVEKEVLRHRGADLVLVEGQGALIHPASTANLPLLRGTMPTHLVLCHRAGLQTLKREPWVTIPPLLPYAKLYEDLAEACGAFRRPKTAAVALDTRACTCEEAKEAIRKTEEETGLPTTDPVRFGPEKLLDAVL
jgi:uncharacterized NAD-dependent epimerase/dehydratase family protein